VRKELLNLLKWQVAQFAYCQSVCFIAIDFVINIVGSPCMPAAPITHSLQYCAEHWVQYIGCRITELILLKFGI
jgi:hypothetical protein